MAMRGKLGWVLQFIGLGTMIAWMSAGGSLMATVYVGSLNLLDGWTRWQQALALAGLFIVLFAVLRAVLAETRLFLRWVVHRTPWRAARSEEITHGADTSLLESIDKNTRALLAEFSETPQPTPGSHFPPRSIIVDRPGVALGGLWNAEPSFTVWMNIQNVSGFPVEITGTTGRISIAGVQCRMPYEVRVPGPLTNFDSYMTLWIEQPVTPETKQQLLDMFQQENGQFRIDLNSLLLTGTVTLPDGIANLKNCNLIVPALVVRGPLRTPEDGQVQPWETLFWSPTIYNNIGERIV